MSLCAHILVVFSSMIVVLPNLKDSPVPKRKKFEVKITNETKFVASAPIEPELEPEKLRFESREFAGRIDSFIDLERQESNKKDVDVFKSPEADLAKIEAMNNLFDVKKSFKLPKSVVKRTRDTSKADSEVMSVSYSEIVERIDQEIELAELEDVFINKMPGFTPNAVIDNQDMSSYAIAGSSLGKGNVGGFIKRKKEIGDFTGDLFWSFEVYADESDAKRYFRIRVRLNEEASNFKAVPKEISILVDCSKSIDDERLDEFRDGIERGLATLNEGDLFNVTVFKDRVFTFSKTSVSPTEKNIKAALAFLSKFQVGEKTDTFDVLERAVKRRAYLEPSYILLLSDGRPTKGETNSRDLINKISKVNRGKKSIFAFSGGQWTNRYLLDFISYNNRGWAEYSYRTNRIAQNLEALFERIDEPLILNLRYLISGINEDETFPHVLPDFFRKAEFTLYGTYDDKPEILMQLLGDVDGETKEFIMQGAFAEATKGDRDIAINWAYNKIYHLISQLKKSQKKNGKILEEIDILLKKFNLKMPYLKDITQ